MSGLFLEECEDGIYSREVEGAGKNNLYVGLAGILHMYLQFYLVEHYEKSNCQRDIDYEHIIKEMTRYLSIHWKDGLEYVKQNGEAVLGMAEAFYGGIGGIGMVLNEVYKVFADESAKKAVWEIITYYKEHAVRTEKGIYWSDNSAIFFDGGITLFLIDSFLTYQDEQEVLKNSVDEVKNFITDKDNRKYNEKDLYRLITDSCDYILANGIYHDDGGLEIDHMQVDFKHKEPNFEFGTAGIGYLFAKVYEITNDIKYLQAAKAAGIYLKNIAVKKGRGYLIPYKLGKYDDLFYLGNCHGPVGTAKLFYELYKVTDNNQYLQEVFSLYEGAAALGAPFVQSAGFWNTTCICCGPAGYAAPYVGLYYETGDDKWKELAHGVGEILVGTKSWSEKNQNQGYHWEIAFDRTKPEIITSPAGYLSGTAGIAVALLQIYCMHTNNKGCLCLIDDPYLKWKR